MTSETRTTTPHQAYAVRQNELLGAGAGYQALGLIVMVGGWIFGITIGMLSLVLGICLLIAGGKKARSVICSHCRNPLASAEVRICPACHSQIVQKL